MIGIIQYVLNFIDYIIEILLENNKCLKFHSLSKHIHHLIKISVIEWAG